MTTTGFNDDNDDIPLDRSGIHRGRSLSTTTLPSGSAPPSPHSASVPSSPRSNVIRPRSRSVSHATPPSRSGAHAHSSGAALGGPDLNIARIQQFIENAPAGVFSDIKKEPNSITATIPDTAPEAKGGKSRLTFTGETPNRVHVSFDHMTPNVARHIIWTALSNDATYINLEKLQADQQKQLMVIEAYIAHCKYNNFSPVLEFRNLSTNVEAAYNKLKSDYMMSSPPALRASLSSSRPSGYWGGGASSAMFRGAHSASSSPMVTPPDLEDGNDDDAGPRSPTASSVRSSRSNSSSSSD